MIRARRSLKRGQAITEAALGMCVLVTVISVGIFFAEFGAMQLKVTEAANAAIWDSVAGPKHEWPMDDSPAGGQVANARAQANSRYQNFDGRSPTAWANAPTAGTVTKALTQATGLDVQCSIGSGPNYRRPLYPLLMAVFGDNGGMSCTSRASANAIRIPTAFLDNGSGAMFKASNQGSSMFAGLPMCGLGRCNRSGGQGEFNMLIDDWSFSGGSENGNCNLIIPYGAPCVGNLPYYTSGLIIYTVESFAFGLQSMADRNLINGVYQTTPWWPWVPPVLGPTAFYLSSMNEDTIFIQPLLWATDPWFVSIPWNTTPYFHPLFAPTISHTTMRESCFPGRECGSQLANFNP
jgi:hypothetical protein